jgi:hypothetical protein
MIVFFYEVRDTPDADSKKRVTGFKTMEEAQHVANEYTDKSRKKGHVTIGKEMVGGSTE